MTVEEMIAKLEDLPPGVVIVFEGQKEDVCWAVRGVIQDENDNFVMLLRGDKVPVTVDA